MKADEDSSFPHFLKLAPELRVMIYGYAMDNKARTRPSPPPICCVNREIRKESIPVFFGNVMMNVHVFAGESWEKPYEGDYAVVVGQKSMHISKAYLEYFAYATEKHYMEDMRHFQWYVSSYGSTTPGHLKRHRTDIFQFKWSKLMENLHKDHTIRKNGRLIRLFDEVIEGSDKDNTKMTPDRFDCMLTWLMGDRIDLKMFERD